MRATERAVYALVLLALVVALASVRARNAELQAAAAHPVSAGGAP